MPHSRKPLVSRVLFVFALVMAQIISLFGQPFALDTALAQPQSADTLAVSAASAVQTTDCAGNSKGFRLTAANQSKLAQLQQAAGGQLRIACHSVTGKVRFIGGQASAPVASQNAAGVNSSEEAARNFLAAYGDLFGLQNQASELVLEKIVAPNQGAEAVRFQQFYNGLPVIGAEVTVQLDAKRQILAVGGEILPDLAISPVAKLTDSEASQQAQTVIAKKYGRTAADLTVKQPELAIYNSGLLDSQPSSNNKLVWKTEIFAAPSSNGHAIDEFVLVDAQTGGIALSFSQVEFAKDRFVCDLNNTAVGNNVPSCTSASATLKRTEGQPATGNADVDSAYDLAGDTYDFYKNYFNRDSLDGNGMPLRSTVKLCFSASQCPYSNAFWLDQTKQMYYGDGFPVADDVVGHELTHGFTSYTSNLYYYFQSGAINESLSDVYGEFVDQTNNRDGIGGTSPTQRWQLGEDLPNIGAIRDMKNPPSFSDPDRVGSNLYHVITNTGSLAFDNGGVHSNSGVNNKAAYLLTDGDTFNGYTIAGIGLTKTAQIYYETETKLLSTASDYQDLYSYLPQACRNLIGQFGISSADCGEVDKVVAATQMNLLPPSQRADVPACQAGLSPQNIFYDNFDNPNSSNWVTNTTVAEAGWFYTNLYTPNSTGYSVVGPNLSVVADSRLSMTSNLPALPAHAYLYIRHSVGLESGSQGAYDGGVIEYSTNNGTTWLATDSMFTNNGYNLTVSASSNPLNGRKVFSAGIPYFSSRLDLSSLAGQSVRFRFRVASDSSASYDGWFIEEARVYTCEAAVANLELTQSSSVSSVGEVVTFTATTSQPTATGIVTFSNVVDNSVLGVVSLSAGVAKLEKSDLQPGQYIIRATYGGDANFGASTSETIVHTVGQVSGCDPLIVTAITDNGTGQTCGTLSHALAQPAPQPLNIFFALTSGNTITLTGPLSPALKAGVRLQGKPSCSVSAPAIVINGNNQASSLELQGNNLLRGLVITNFGGPELKVAAGSSSTRIECSVIKQDAS